MTEPDALNRREALAGIGGAGLVVATLGGLVYWRQREQASVRTDDDDTTVHTPDDDGKSDPESEPTDKHEIEIDMPKKDDERFNSDSVTFVHDAFRVCNRGKSDARIWIDADVIENERGEPAVRFYREEDLGDRIDASKRAVPLEAESCMRVGLMTRTFGIPQETRLVETVYVRTDRTS